MAAKPSSAFSAAVARLHLLYGPTTDATQPHACSTVLTSPEAMHARVKVRRRRCQQHGVPLGQISLAMAA